METLQTERLILRGFRPEDLEEFYQYAKDPEVGPQAGWKPHENREESREILESFIREDQIWAIEEKETGRLAGSIGLHEDKVHTADGDKVRMMGYVLGKSWWGKGYMTEAAQEVLRHAFGSMGLELVGIQHYTDNGRSRRVIEKLGFVYEGTIRRATRLFNGVVKDCAHYSVTNREYRLLAAERGKPLEG